MREVVELEGLSREDWLTARRAGIGSSDAAAILGLDKWRGPLDVFTDKVVPEDERSSSLLMRLGLHMEDGIARAYAEETGSTVTKPTHMYANDDHPWMLANVDRFTDSAGELGVVEIKMAHRYEDWEDGAPQGYEIQVTHQLGVTGLPYGDLAALVGGRELRLFRIERDEATIANLIEIEAAFWDQVQRRDPPPPDHRSADSLKRLYSGGADAIELDPSIATIISELRTAKTALKQAEERHEHLANQVRFALGDAEIGTIGGVPAASWKRTLRASLDRSRLEDDYPQVFAACQKSTPVRTLRLGKAL